MTKYPAPDTEGRDKSIFSEMIKQVVKNMTIPVSILDVTSMSAFRSDGHVGLWSDNPLVPDCSHWCLPGLPDIWNEILLFFLLSRQQVKTQLYLSIFPNTTVSVYSLMSTYFT